MNGHPVDGRDTGCIVGRESQPGLGRRCSDEKIEAFIRHEAFDPIRTDLSKRNPSMSILEAKGSTAEGDRRDLPGSTVTVNVRPKLKIEIVVADSERPRRRNDPASRSIREIGDGKIFVIPVEESIRIRTGERGDEATQVHLDDQRWLTRIGRRASCPPPCPLSGPI